LILLKIDKSDLKHNNLLFTPENLTDLYIISQIIEFNDHVFGNTTRRIRSSGKDSREGDKGEKVRVYLGILVLEVDFQDSVFDQRLRVKGKIISGPEDIVPLNSSHTINISVNNTFTIHKEFWLDYHFKLLKSSEESNRPLIGIIGIERGLFTIAMINNFKIDRLVLERNQIPGKQLSSKIRNSSDNVFFKKILSLVKSYFSNDSVRNIVLAGPGSYKGKFLEYMQEEWPNHNKIVLLEDLSSATSTNELINRETLIKLASKYQVFEELSIISEFEKRLGQDFEKICYGIDQSLQSVEQGALESVLIIDTLIRTTNDEEKKTVLKIMDDIEKTKVKYFIVDNKSDNGKIVSNFGGIIGLLRYAMFFDSE
jgi:protein pelota